MAVPDATEPLGLRDRAILEVLYASAIRRSELVDLKLYGMDQGCAMLMVRKGKGNKDRVVPLGERAAVWLATSRDRVRRGLVTGRNPGNLFLSRDGRAFCPKRLPGTSAFTPTGVGEIDATKHAA